MNEFMISGGVLFLFGALSAKWAMELGYSQLAQIGMFFFGLLLGPLVLLHLYVKMLHRRSKAKEPGAQFFGNSQPNKS